MGGKGHSYDGDHELEGGFGGGGGTIIRSGNGSLRTYFGCGGGYTGGSSRIRDVSYNHDVTYCYGGGGGSFTVDPNAIFDHKFKNFGKCTIKFLH